MRILFALSQIELTGAETYAVTLASALKRLGHEVVFVSDKIKDPRGHKFIPLPIHERNTSYWGRFQNVLALRGIIRSEKIDLVHSHSRAANLVAQFGRPMGVPMVVTVHGRWRVHFAAKVLPCLGQRTIAVCPYLQRYLQKDIGISNNRSHMIPNGIDTDFFSPGPRRAPEREILYVGRLTGQKGNAFRFLLKRVFPRLMKTYAHFRIRAITTPSPRDEEEVKRFNDQMGKKLASLEVKDGSLVPDYRKAAVVIGSGRVALEAMSCGKAVVAIGESSAPGLLNQQNFERAFDSNFGDCGPWNLFERQNRQLGDDLDRILSEPYLERTLSEWGRKRIQERFSADKVARKVDEIYKELKR